MAAHNDLGRMGENLAEKYLLDRGYDIIRRNWTYKKLELDIIASKDGMLHFVEVKTRTTNEFGLPEEAVNEIKISFLIAAGEEFLYQHPEWTSIQFDILSICINAYGDVEFFLIEDVYF